MARKERFRMVDGVECRRPPGEPWQWEVTYHRFAWDSSTQQRLIANRGHEIAECDLGYQRSLTAAVRRSKDHALNVIKEGKQAADKTEKGGQDGSSQA